MSRSWLDTLFGIDPRSLAVLRVGLGLLILCDTWVRWFDIGSMYADGALMSIEASRKVFLLPTVWHWSLHNLSGAPEYQAFLLLLAAAAGTALVLGWRTWWANLACWALLASVHVRAPLTPNGGDMLLRMMLFWSLFAPLGRVWSLDALRRARREEPAESTARRAAELGGARERIVSAGTAALMIQLVLMYFFTGLFKSNEDWFTGRGLYLALSLDCYLRPFGQYLLGFPELLKWLTWGTLVLELATPLLVFSPWQTARLRLATLAAYLALHIGIQFSFTVGLFSAVSIVAWAVFLPNEFWNSAPLSWLAGRLSSAWPAKRGLPNEATNGSPAHVAPSAASGGRWQFAVQGLCLFLLIYTTFANVASLYPGSEQSIPPSVLRLGQATNILQRWDMFGRISRGDGWYAARARLKDGSVVDILRGGAPYTDDKPQLASAILPNQHWRYFFQALVQPANAAYRQEAAEHLFRAWNARHAPEKQILSLDLMYFHEVTDRDLTPGDFVSERFATVTAPEAASGAAFDDVLDSLKRGAEWVP